MVIFHSYVKLPEGKGSQTSNGYQFGWSVGRIDASFFVVLAGSPTGRSSSQSVVPPQRKCLGTNAVAFFAWKINRQIANMALGLRTLSVFASVCSHVMFVGSVPNSVIGCAFYWTICIFCRLIIYEDLTSRRHRNDGERIGNHPQMAAFQLFSGR